MAGLAQGLTITVGQLLPLPSPELVEPRRKRLEALSDAQLLETVIHPSRGDPLRVEPETGQVCDGNARAYERRRRAQDAQSAITLETRVPYQPYRRDRSMFYDLTED